MSVFFITFAHPLTLNTTYIMKRIPYNKLPKPLLAPIPEGESRTTNVHLTPKYYYILLLTREPGSRDMLWKGDRELFRQICDAWDDLYRTLDEIMYTTEPIALGDIVPDTDE